tara:strand:- start:226 stop:423 length:198 start_codon:yes stop_codon:yes gene_type:complete
MTDFEDKLGKDGDVFYDALIKTHEGLSEEQSHELNARLVLILANEVGNIDTLNNILKAARSDNHE